LPQDWEVSLGKEIRQQTLSGMQEDKGRSIILNKLLSRYRFRKEGAEGFQPQFYVVSSKDFNAFAVPGGSIFVHSAAIEKVRSLPELLALIGHENGHVQERHTMRTLARSLGLYGLVSFFLGDLSGLAAILIDNAQSLQNLSYSRDFEREADQAAFDFLCRNGIDSRGLISLMETMQKETGDKSALLPGFLSSHPLTEERLENARAAVKNNSCKISYANPEQEALFKILKKQ
jgi:predicted Zn-dependent protease